jgi:hypothetical protein
MDENDDIRRALALLPTPPATEAFWADLHRQLVAETHRPLAESATSVAVALGPRHPPRRNPIVLIGAAAVLGLLVAGLAWISRDDAAVPAGPTESSTDQRGTAAQIATTSTATAATLDAATAEHVEPDATELLPYYAFGYSDEDLVVIGHAADLLVQRCAAEHGLTHLTPMVDIGARTRERAAATEFLRFDDPAFVIERGYRSPFAGSADSTAPTPSVDSPIPNDCWTRLYEAFKGAGAGYLRNDVSDLVANWPNPFATLSSDPTLTAPLAAWSQCMFAAGYPAAEVGTASPGVVDVGAQAVADSACRIQSGYRDALFDALKEDVAAFAAKYSNEIAAVQAARAAELKIAAQIVASS